MIDTKNPVVEFNAQDRCDRCGAQAYTSASKDGLELLFCAHHTKRHGPVLEAEGWKLAFDTVGLASLTGEKVEA